MSTTPAVLEALSDEECELYAILSDESGLDQAEFLWFDPDAKYGCFRAWAFQWAWYRCIDPLQIDCCARSVGKSMSIKVRAFAFPFLFPGQEMVITAPELVHLEPIVSLIEGQISATRLTRELLPAGRSAVTHRPFQMNFVNGARIIGRIPQKDGKGVKGIHPVWLEMDESQDYPHAGWIELTETLKRGHEGAVWRAHGVTRGLRDDFYEHTQDTPDNEWTVHRFAAMWRPSWTAQERTEKIKQYGSRDDPDYRRNVLGLHGDATNPMFVLTRLMKCVDDDDHSEYNEDEYFQATIKAETLALFKQQVEEVMDFPPRHKSYLPKASFWSGMDVGYTTDPSEIVTFVEYRPKGTERSVLKLLSRVSMQRMSHGDQVRAILHTIESYRPRVFAMDKTGLGLPLFKDIQERAEDGRAPRNVLDIIKGYNFSEKITVGFDDSIEVDEFKGDAERDAGIRRSVLEYASDTLRTLVDENRLILPWDAELLKQFQGSTWMSARGGMDQYGRRVFSKGNDHCIAYGVLVTTDGGDLPIEEVVAGNHVLTRAGYRRVLAAWQSSPSADVYRVRTADGREVTATAEHRFFTNRGWVSLDALRMDDILLTCRNIPETRSKSLSSKVSSSGAIPTRRPGQSVLITRPVSPTGRGAFDGFMRRFGWRSTGQYHPVTAFITWTKIPLTMIWATWTAFLVPTICVTMAPGTKVFVQNPTWFTSRVLDLRLRPGIHRKRGGRGIPSMLGLWRRNSRGLNVSASTVAVPSRLVSRGCGSSVPIAASRSTNIVSPRSRGSAKGVAPFSSVQLVSDGFVLQSVGIRSIEKLSERSAVYDLTVEGEHEFFAGGVLVHNCLDACRMATLGWVQYAIEEVLKKPKDDAPVFDSFV